MTATAIIVTCERDRAFTEACVAGIRKYWSGVEPMVILDTDRETEAPLPPDIREMVRRMPVLRRVFDVPYVSPTENIYSLDSDCLVFSDPTDFPVPAYQGVAGHDPVEGLEVWASLGKAFPIAHPKLCGGMYSYRKSDFLGLKDLAIEYLRRCRLRGLDRGQWPGVVCEQSLVAGMWRLLYNDHPLPADRYPLNRPTESQVIFHISDSKWGGRFDEYVRQYMEAI